MVLDLFGIKLTVHDIHHYHCHSYCSFNNYSDSKCSLFDAPLALDGNVPDDDGFGIFRRCENCRLLEVLHLELQSVTDANIYEKLKQKTLDVGKSTEIELEHGRIKSWTLKVG
jgi:hypothetical protein